MTEEQLLKICELHPGLAEALYMLKMAGVPWEDLQSGLQEYLRQQRKTLN